MKLTYPTEPEIMTYTSPLGRLHHIPVWMPIGERGEPIETAWLPSERNKNFISICDQIVIHLRKGDGLTSWQIADAINQDRRTVGRNLADNEQLFRRSDNPINVGYVAGRGQQRVVELYLWYLREGN